MDSDSAGFIDNEQVIVFKEFGQLDRGMIGSRGKMLFFYGFIDLNFNGIVFEYFPALFQDNGIVQFNLLVFYQVFDF
jgi:hypothetical protein